MKRYFAFYGHNYYPAGGMGDFIGDFDTIDEAIERINQEHLNFGPTSQDWKSRWKSIWDSETKTYILGDRSEE